MLTHFVPDGIHVGYLIFKEEVVAESKHYFLNFSVRRRHKDATAFLDFILALVEVVVELIDELVTLIHSRDMALPPTHNFLYKLNMR